MNAFADNKSVPLGAAAAIQARIIGAILMREIHTRFGRNNIGYLWLFLEPLLFSLCVISVHFATRGNNSFGMPVAPFYICGYTPFLMFRSIVNRATATIDSNRTLMYHRHVTIFNLLFARAVLDAAAITLSMFVLLGGAVALGLGDVPDRPLLIFIALGLMFWICFALSLPVAALQELSTATEQIVHPFTYITLPFSGTFFLVEWIPSPYKEWLLYIPLIHINQLLREGQFGGFDSQYVDIPYVVAWCMVLTFIGLLAIRLIRPHLEIE
jgi:capsular polysaccharide transport system permease protein